MSKHTPGPWCYHPVKEGTLNIKTGAKSEMRDAGFSVRATEPKMFGGTIIIDKGIRSEADARLIATAPQLLEVTRAFADWFREFEGKDVIRELAKDCPQWKALCAVIDRAEGK